MNGRVQDPKLGRFISADPIVQAPDHSQSLNRYSYVWNNPLTMTDPTGFYGEECSQNSSKSNCLHPPPADEHDICDRYIGMCSITYVDVRYVNVGAGTYEHWINNPDGSRTLNAAGTWYDGYGWTEFSMAGELLAWVDTLGNFGGNSLSTGFGPGGSPMIEQVPTFGDAVRASWEDGRQFSSEFSITLGVGEILGPLAGPMIKWFSANLLKAGAAAAERGITVLGRNPAYVELANAIPSKSFNVPTWVWDTMTEAQQLATNMRFLDRLIARGDEVYLATRASAAPPGSFYYFELEYLMARGYTLSDDGWRLLPPVH